MQRPADVPQPQAAANAEDHSICLEAHGFLSQSYDSLDSLLREIAHSDVEQPAGHGSAFEVSVVGVPDGLMPFHLFL
ncbi:hypothetical protein PQR75_46215 [Paraburkholderia fungorum]|uniref:hypothetical protein n=1 Tax=Paraburkholderia fungorum TaxID=134537 RepID=UPI0038B85E2C